MSKFEDLAILSHNSYDVRFYKGGELIASKEIFLFDLLPAIVQQEFIVPDRAADEGYDQIHILPTSVNEQGKYCLAFLVFRPEE